MEKLKPVSLYIPLNFVSTNHDTVFKLTREYKDFQRVGI